MKIGLVLGGGGLIGMGYHAGALKALDELGADPTKADLIVGTSAGAVLGAYLRSGWTAADFHDYAHGRHPKAEKTEEDQKAQVREIFTPMWADRPERVRRAIGGVFAAASSRGIWAKAGGRIPGAVLRHAFPAGLYSTEGTRKRLTDDLPARWPKKDVYICAADLYSGERVAFGHPFAPEARLPEAVLASTAIPGVFPPVKIGERQYVDGGVKSATSLDLAVDAGCDAIICVAPLGYRRDEGLSRTDLKLFPPMVLRALFARSLRREVVGARNKGIDVLVIRPWLTDLKVHGTNSMRHYDRTKVVEGAREGTLRLLEQHSEHPALKAFQKNRRKERTG
ncbi:MAG: patatin-like phospholipase family protein [Actinomycetota bacterium]|nr:patatin-like phospholipase family protein [Actinomycetota bacterium]